MKGQKTGLVMVRRWRKRSSSNRASPREHRCDLAEFTGPPSPSQRSWWHHFFDFYSSHETSRLRCENLKRNMISDCKYDQRWITCKVFPPIGLVFNHSKSSVQTVDVSCFLICLNTAEMKHFILDQSPKLKNKANTQPPNTAVPLMSSRGSSELIPIDCHVKTLQLK